MANLKKALLLGILGATAAASLAGFFLLGGSAARLAVDGALALVITGVVFVMMAPTEKRVDLLIDALRALARGERHQRVNPDEFAGLSEVARAMNEVAASLTENEDPNLGPVKSVPRKKDGTPALPKPPKSDLDDPSVGPVRKLRKGSTPPAAESARVPSQPPAASPAADAVPPAEPPAKAGSNPPVASATSAAPGSKPPDIARPDSAAPTNDTSIDDARADVSGEGPSGEGPSGEGSAEAEEIAALPTRAELEQLFAEFVAQKKAHDESVAELDLDAFAQTILGECERLLAAHRCRGVKFEITEQDGEVSLRPRLLR